MSFTERHERRNTRPPWHRLEQLASEPLPPDPQWPRYSSQPFPAYRFVPGVTPHPRRHPQGHSYGQPEPAGFVLDPDRWRENDAYLFGVDLYNFAYWWECHEVFEGFWRAANRQSQKDRLFQALIQVAAANLKICMGSPSAAERLNAAAVQRFQTMPQTSMGIDIRVFERDLRAYADGSREAPALIRLPVPAVQMGTNTADMRSDDEQDLQR